MPFDPKSLPTRSPIPPTATQPPEYRPYRRFLSWVILSVICVGSVYLLASVGVTIYRRRNVVTPGERVGVMATAAELESCENELWEVTHGLEKHLESFHRLFDHYDSAQAQQWSEEGDRWRNEWIAVGRRCRFDEVRGGRLSKELEAMAAAHGELGETQRIYTRELRRFGREQAPRLDRIRERLNQIRERLRRAQQKETTR